MPAPNIETLLDFETPLEKMFAHLFGSAGISVYTPANASFVDDPGWQAENPALVEYVFSSEDEFQKHTPRVELVVNLGTATGHLSESGDTFSAKRCDAYEGTVLIGVITKPNVLEHRAFVARVRKLMGDEWTTFERHAPQHEINKCLESGTSNEYAPENGWYRTTITFETHFSIRADAWPV